MMMSESADSISSSKVSSGANVSYWLDSVEPIKYQPLKENITTDVVVIGGGIAGITTAYMAAQKDFKVVVIEDGYIGSGETGRTTAHIVNALDDRYYELEDYFGEEGIKKIAESHTAVIDTIEKIITDENLSCDFERLTGYLFLHPTDERNSLEEELRATNMAGINTILLNDPPGLSAYNGPALSFPAQATFHPLKFIKGLCDSIIKNGGKIYTETRAEDVDSPEVTVKGGFKIKAKHIVVATNTPFLNRFVIHTKQAPYRTYVIAGKVKKGTLPHALWWDTGDHNSEWHTNPYHYVRIQNYNDQFDLLISGGEDHKTGQALEEKISEEERFKKLETWTRKHFPAMEEVLYTWSGQVMEPVDGLGFIGKNPLDADNVYISTGDSGNGMTHGVLAGIIISDMIAGINNKWIEIYDPSRKTIKAADVFIEEQANVAKQYVDYVTSGDIKTPNDLKPGSGAIIRDGLTKAAVFRDEAGTLYSFSAVCPHLKCIVKWNSGEKTFDCPCHGSRFNCYGELLNGPANSNLEKIVLDSSGKKGDKEDK
jgi:glycine/D-amino acid oxidase-like deaminating enzyme/nitrite reductase/ring-hydroxylating ferredoxin subunit